MIRRTVAAVLFSGVLATASLYYPHPASADLEEPAYKVLQKDGSVEIRQYEPVTAAQVTVSGSRSAASRKAFNILFGYISGENTEKQKISMTAPVRQTRESVKIPMTAPVAQVPAGSRTWNVAFYLPSSFSEKTAPVPDNDAISIISVPGQKVAAITFSGRWTNSNFQRHTKALEAYMKTEGLKAIGSPVFAYFNAPFTLPPFRRNEVQIPIRN
ncbi:SOUL heme-binding protein [Roseibium hamelinense]|uniref:SOUL heme-binding protein n=1 Tax=Roseibium hamelinense TaxID=150831 RepID=A0A562TH86_9HYPH|nr:heme-binding protein [Roseibium hamelinense]TWI92991.1 SOUL heme-binding protein [Roseibium hamelinense]